MFSLVVDTPEMGSSDDDIVRLTSRDMVRRRRAEHAGMSTKDVLCHEFSSLVLGLVSGFFYFLFWVFPGFKSALDSHWYVYLIMLASPLLLCVVIVFWKQIPVTFASAIIISFFSLLGFVSVVVGTRITLFFYDLNGMFLMNIGFNFVMAIACVMNRYFDVESQKVGDCFESSRYKRLFGTMVFVLAGGLISHAIVLLSPAADRWGCLLLAQTFGLALMILFHTAPFYIFRFD